MQGIGRAIKAAMERRGFTQEQAARSLYVSRQLLGHWCSEVRPINLQQLTQLAALFDDADFYFDVSSCATNGVLGKAAEVDGGRAASLIAAQMELEGTLEALHEGRRQILGCPERADREAVESVLLRAMDARAVLASLIVSLCGEYGISLRELSRRHNGRMQMAGYAPRRAA